MTRLLPSAPFLATSLLQAPMQSGPLVAAASRFLCSSPSLACARFEESLCRTCSVPSFSQRPLVAAASLPQAAAATSLQTSSSSVCHAATFPAASCSPLLPHHSLTIHAAGSSSSRRHALAVGGAGSMHAASSSCTPVPHAARGGSRAFFTILGTPANRQWEQRRLVGWTPEQFYKVVSEVDQYKHFVPWCQKSVVKRRVGTTMEAELEVGFQMLKERYTSIVTLEPPRVVRSRVGSGSSLLFHHLDSSWIMDAGPAPRTCWVRFQVDFAFNSNVYNNFADLFFSQVVKEMVGAFEGRCAKLHGPSSLVAVRHA